MHEPMAGGANDDWTGYRAGTDGGSAWRLTDWPGTEPGIRSTASNARPANTERVALYGAIEVGT